MIAGKEWLGFAWVLAGLASCQASYSRTTKTEMHADGSLTKETNTDVTGGAFTSGGSIKTDGTSVEVTVQGPAGTTTSTPAPGEAVPIPEGTTSVDTKESVAPKTCPKCGHVLNRAILASSPRGHLHAAYHRFEHYVPEGEWEGYLYVADASPFSRGRKAAEALWGGFVANLTQGFTHVPDVPSALRDARFYGMRVWADGGQLYLSFADVQPFSSLSIQLSEVGTTNSVRFDLDTPGVRRSSANGWYFADIPIEFVPLNGVDPTIEIHPTIQNPGSSFTKGYVRRIDW